MLSEAFRNTLANLASEKEEACLEALLPLAQLDDAQRNRVSAATERLIPEIRARMARAAPVARMVHGLRLDEPEGRALMGLAEALPRVPDPATADLLINDKLAQGDWRHFMERYPGLVSKLAWFGLLLGKQLKGDGTMVGRIGAGALRETLRTAMERLGGHFVLGGTIEEALAESRKHSLPLQRYSFDMLGEAARTRHDADRYFENYKNAIAAVAACPGAGDALFGPSVSVKLSALHPRFEPLQREPVLRDLTPRLIELVEMAAASGVGLTVDSEEAARLELTLEVIAPVFGLPALKEYRGFGYAVQAYDKRAPAVLDWLDEAAAAKGVDMTVRLVKGAYWDKEIKLAQERGLAAYPVYTRKAGTDTAYLACACKLLASRPRLFPQFATHNLHTLLTIREMAGEMKDYEIQRLFGMGKDVHACLMDMGIPGSIYAPVGPQRELLGYLIRRLLENASSASFVNQLADAARPARELAGDPVTKWQENRDDPCPVPPPRDIYGNRRGSAGIDPGALAATGRVSTALKSARNMQWSAAPMHAGEPLPFSPEKRCTNPGNRFHDVGARRDALPAAAAKAVEGLARGFPEWVSRPVAERCKPFEALAAHMESDFRDELLALLCYEAGKTFPDALAEIREAVDLCRYYAAEAKRLFAPRLQPGPAGEENRYVLTGRGVFACISPWNFPLAIYLGQIAAALMAGNTVAAKPAPQTPLIACRTARMLIECGLPPGAFALLPGDGLVGKALVEAPGLAGVAFTGSTATAQGINRALAARNGPIVPLIAETGGLNAIIADATAFPEQVVDDVIASCFRSAGQRCSAARLLCVQSSLAPALMEMLEGALVELEVGNPALLSTDVGPVIDEAALNALMAHEERLRKEAKFIGGARRNEEQRGGHFILPQAWEIPDTGWLKEDVFGPILHVVRFQEDELDKVIDALNAKGYALTGGLHTRITARMHAVATKLRVGNFHINRPTTGAVVESQPFGGEGLSGTGPKAGGPHYLPRFASERVTSRNLMAEGGDMKLLI